MNKDTLLGLVRHVLTFAGGFAVAKGWTDTVGLETIVGGLVTVIGGVWSAWDKRQRG